MSLSTKSFSVFKRDIFLYITQMVTSVIVARKLGPEAMGILVILNMIPSYAESFGRMKFDIAAVYFLGKNKYKLGDVVFTLNILAALTSILIVAPILVEFEWFYNLLFSKSSMDVRILMFLILFQIPLNFLYMNYSYLLIHKEDIQSYNRMVIIRSLVSSVVSIALILIFGLTLIAVIATSILAFLIALLYGIFKLRHSDRKTHIINIPLIKDLFSYGSKLYVSGLIGYFQAYITNLIVVLYLLPAQVAYFSMARGFGQMMDKVPGALNTILFPRITKMESIDESAQLSAKAFRITLILLIFTGILAFLFIKPAVYVLYGATYVPLVTPFLIIIPGIILAGSASPLQQFFIGIGRVDLSVKLPLIPLIVQVLLSLALIPGYGVIGAAISFLIGLILFSIASVFVFLKITARSINNDLIIGRKDLAFVTGFFISEAKRIQRMFQRNDISKL